MKPTSVLVAALSFAVMFSACNKSASQGAATGAAPAAAVAVANPDGQYVFDQDAFKTMLQNTDDPALKQIPEEVLKQTIDGLKDFRIDLKGMEATATFGTVVVKGTLSKTGEANGEVRYLMTPSEEDKKSDTVTFILKDGTLTLDPGRKESDRMFFKKVS